jgi:SAM-dependent methyltransferase
MKNTRKHRMDAHHPASSGTFLLLDEAQNVTYNVEYHTSEELEAKLTAIDELCHEPFPNILDLGGGNGAFADQLLARFPKSTVTILDISAALLEKNISSPRKELVHGSIEDMLAILPERNFDYITINWVLHHLVGNNYRACKENCVRTLKSCKALLRPNGMLIIAEDTFEGYLGSNLPSHLIYAITSIRWRWFVRLSQGWFNTAGVGVCFQSQQVWQRIFVETGFDLIAFQRGLVWWWLRRSLRGLVIHLLFVKSISHGHFFLKPRAFT